MTADYRLLYRDVFGGGLLGEVSMLRVQASKALNAVGSLTATIPLAQARRARLTNQVAPLEYDVDTLAPARTKVYLDRDGVILWGGILWAVRANVAAGTAELAAEGFHSYFRRRLINHDRVYEQVDQTAIAAALIDYAQGVHVGDPSLPVGDIGISTDDVTATGVLRDRSYPAFERKNLGEAIEQLADVNDGFDWRYDSTWSAGAIVDRFLTSYPATGRETDLAFDIGRNVDALDYTSDGTLVANSVYALGSGEGADKLTASALALESLSAAYPLLNAVVTHVDVTVAATLSAHAERRAQLGSAPLTAVRLGVFPDVDPTIGSYEVGDIVMVRGDVGLVDLDERMRIVALALAVDESGQEEVTIDLVDTAKFEEVV